VFYSLPFEGEGKGGVVSKNTTTAVARKLRNNSTEVEKKLWYFLRGYRKIGIKFRRQQPIGIYYPDFVCLDKKLIVELDGGQHFQSLSDNTRAEWLKKEGFKILRFWDNEVFENVEAVMNKILEYCQ
jgi:very-short-patch-repair endonuclease